MTLEDRVRRHASPAIVANQREGRKAEFDHHVNSSRAIARFELRKVVIRRIGCPAAPISAQVHADHRVVLGKLGREGSPHQARAGEAVHHQNGRSVSITAHDNRVS